ncbi:hypothetical protein GA845_23545, partial [Burkholderia pseudomallei]|nr:hypothetical protein [Burkholderia pseudomallei]
ESALARLAGAGAVAVAVRAAVLVALGERDSRRVLAPRARAAAGVDAKRRCIAPIAAGRARPVGPSPAFPARSARQADRGA